MAYWIKSVQVFHKKEFLGDVKEIAVELPNF